MKRALFLTFLCYFTLMHCETDVKLETGFRLREMTKVIYDGQAILFYQSEIPIFHDIIGNYSCEYDNGICELFQHVKLIAAHTLDILNHSLPHLADLEMIKTRRVRSIEWLSDPFNWCCGVAQQSGLDTLAQRQHDLEKISDNIRAQITEQHSAAVKNSMLIHHFTEELKEVVNKQLNRIENEFHDISEAENTIEKKLTIYAESISIIAKLVYRLAMNLNYLKLLQQCRNRQIPSAIIENMALKNDLEYLEEEMEKHGKELAIKTRNIHAYLHIHTTDCFFSGKDIIIKVGIPIKSRKHNYKFYTVGALPFIYEKKVCTVKLSENFLIVRNGNEIIPLTPATAHSCISSPICHVTQYPSYLSHDQLCLEAGLSGKATVAAIKTSCVFTCSKHDLDKPIILELGETEFGVIFPNSTVSIRCPNQPKIEKSTASQIGILTVNLGCNCSMKVGTQLVRADFPCQKSADPSVGTAVHKIASAWTFNADELLVSGNTKLRNTSNLINHDWMGSIYVSDFSVPPLKPFEPNTHQRNAHVISYSTIILVIILAVIVFIAIYKGKTILNTLASLMDPMSLVEKVLSLLFSRPAVTTAHQITADSAEMACTLYYSLTAIQIFILFGIFCLLLLTYLLVRRSKILSIFQEELADYDKGKIKISMINSHDAKQPAKILSHKFSFPMKSDSSSSSAQFPSSYPNINRLLTTEDATL